MAFYYFGCTSDAGHFLHSNPPARSLEDHRALYDLMRTNPWGLGIDGRLCPPGKDARCQRQGEALIHHKGGWTALAFWDRSMDSRGGSNSVFLTDEPDLDFTRMLALAREHFPRVVGRFGFPIVDVTPHAAS